MEYQHNINIAVLRRKLTEYFSESELKDLYFDLNIDYDRLPGNNKSDKVRELIAFTIRNSQLDELIIICSQMRPRVKWKVENIPEKTYSQLIDESYRSHFNNVRWGSSIQYIYQQAGKVYSDIFSLNRSVEFDHVLIFYIAGWIKINIENFTTNKMSQHEIAAGITDQILIYLSSRYIIDDTYKP